MKVKSHLLFSIPFVIDQTNFDESYSRNYIRNTVIPLIEKRFPHAEKSISVLAEIVRDEDEFLDEKANEYLKLLGNGVKILSTIPKVLFPRALITALKRLGVTKDWENAHIKRAYSLYEKQVGKIEDLLLGVVAVKEPDGIVVYKKSSERNDEVLNFKLGAFNFKDYIIRAEIVSEIKDLKLNQYGDLDKINKDAVFRTMKDGDVFKACNGKTKKLSDFFLEKKVPLRLRREIPLLAIDNEVLVVFDIAVSAKIKIDENTKNIIKFTKE